MDACPKCGGIELAIDCFDYVTVYGVIDSDEDFQEQTSKFHDREDVPGGEVRCVACGYATTNEEWPEGKAKPKLTHRLAVTEKGV